MREINPCTDCAACQLEWLGPGGRGLQAVARARAELALRVLSQQLQSIVVEGALGSHQSAKWTYCNSLFTSRSPPLKKGSQGAELTVT